jgi:hypothetical protein
MVAPAWLRARPAHPTCPKFSRGRNASSDRHGSVAVSRPTRNTRDGDVYPFCRMCSPSPDPPSWARPLRKPGFISSGVGPGRARQPNVFL